jgi:hypothetical protein
MVTTPTIQVIENREDEDTSTTNWKTPRSDITSEFSLGALKKIKNSPPLKSLKKKKKSSLSFIKKKILNIDTSKKITSSVKSYDNMAPPVSPVSSSTISISDGSSKTKSDDSIISDISSVKTNAQQDPLTPSIKKHDADQDKTPATNNQTHQNINNENSKNMVNIKNCEFITTPVKVTTTGRRSKSEEKSNRKYVKATPPPPATKKEETELPIPQDDDTNDLPESKRVLGLPSPRANETLYNIVTEKREDSLTSFQERNQEKRQELTQKNRMKKKEETSSEPVQSTPVAPKPNKMFSVEPQFPEHKRKEPTESNDVKKKPRVTEKAIQEKESGFSSLSSIPAWAKVVIPVVAVVAMFAINSIRKK